MNNDNLISFFQKAMEIGKNKTFNVRIYDQNSQLYTEKEMTYLELGLFLTSNTDTISTIKIFTK